MNTESKTVYCKVIKPKTIKKCEHNKTKSRCVDCNKTGICEHNKRRDECVACGGNRICEHKRQKSTCVPCGGSQICEHKKRRNICIECNPTNFCNHNRLKSTCIECDPTRFCEHGKKKHTCVNCEGSGICLHKRLRRACVECNGSGICPHKKLKKRCIDCNGSDICEHKRMKETCILCDGSRVCEHGRQKKICIECGKIQNYLIHLQRTSIGRLFKNSNLTKTNHSIEYLGCDSNYFLEYFKSKMVNEMTFENIHIDHIKPVSRFNLDDPAEFMKCSHYTNLQPLFIKDNLEKHNKWTNENEIFWKEHICNKEYIPLYLYF